MRRRITNCFVAVGSDDAVAGYYTFAAAGLTLIELPAETAKRLPRYPLPSAALIGRPAVDLSFRSIGLGSAIIADAGERSLQPEPTIFALIVDAKDEAAERFYC